MTTVSRLAVNAQLFSALTACKVLSKCTGLLHTSRSWKFVRCWAFSALQVHGLQSEQIASQGSITGSVLPLQPNNCKFSRQSQTLPSAWATNWEQESKFTGLNQMSTVSRLSWNIQRATNVFFGVSCHCRCAFKNAELTKPRFRFIIAISTVK